MTHPAGTPTTNNIHLDPTDYQRFERELDLYMQQVPVTSGVFDLLATAKYYTNAMASRCFDFAG